MGEISRVLAQRSRTGRALLATAAVAGLVIAGAVTVSGPASADTAPASGTPATVSADALPTVQVDGVVWAQVTVGNTVYATGEFDETWPAGQAESSSNETPRANLLAYNITTGALITSFDHSLNARGLAIAASPDGRTVYVVGDFTSVDGQTHNHIAAFSTSTGALLTKFTSSVSAEVDAVAVSSSAVYVGGNFFYAGGHKHTRLAAFAPVSGSLLSWSPSADDNQVSALVISPDGSRVIVGGRFTTLDGHPAVGMGSLDATSGTLEPWTINSVIHDAATGSNAGKCGITTLSTDGTNIYGGGFSYGCGNFEGTFSANPDTGKIVWIDDCQGDTYGTLPVGQVLYVASHAHNCSMIGAFPNGSAPGYNQRATAESTIVSGTDSGPDMWKWNYSGEPDTALLHWFPEFAPGTYTQQDQASWSVTGNADYIAYGGEFPTVNGVAQQGLVRFAVRSLAPNEVGPVATSSITPTATSTSNGTVTLSWTSTWDQDNADITYSILRSGTSTPIGTVTQASSFWQLPTVTYTDTGLTPGYSYTYRIRASDPLGNTIGSDTSNSVTVSASGTRPPTAAFSESCTYLTCSFDASGSTDQDGMISSYSWDFGDGSSTSTSGTTVSHTYSGAGSNTVALTVTDSNSLTDTATQTVDVSAAPAPPPAPTPPAPSTTVARDSFVRAVRSGWGMADVGGRWSSSGCARTDVAGHSGNLGLARGRACSMWLAKVNRSATDTTATVNASSVPAGGVDAYLIGRRISAGTDIRLALHLLPGRRVAVQLQRRINGRTVALSRTVTLRAGAHWNGRILARLEVSGTSSTLALGKVWFAGSRQPSGWLLRGRTSLAALQRRGSVGLAGLLPGRYAQRPRTVTLHFTAVISTATSS